MLGLLSFDVPCDCGDKVAEEAAPGRTLVGAVEELILSVRNASSDRAEALFRSLDG